MRVENERHVNTWEHLAQLIEEYSTGQWIFRGVRDCTYPLIPKIGRPEARKDPATGLPHSHNVAEEKRMVQEFRRIARPYFLHQPTNDLELLAIAQHHGLVTRLLDWTESPLVAAYFAAEVAVTRPNPPAIYAVRDLLTLTGTENPFGLKEVSLYLPPHISPRIPAQRAVFTIHPKPAKEEFQPRRVEKWILSKGRQTFWLKQILDACAVNRAALFPDLDGLADYTGWRYKWGKL